MTTHVSVAAAKVSADPRRALGLTLLGGLCGLAWAAGLRGFLPK
jgi:hypothetical protein